MKASLQKEVLNRAGGTSERTLKVRSSLLSEEQQLERFQAFIQTGINSIQYR